MKVGYKDTPIGMIPKDWDFDELGEERIAEIVMGQSPPSSTYNREGLGLPFLQGKAEFGSIYPNPTIFCSKPIKISEKNDILLSVRAPVGDVNISASKYCIGRGLSAIRPVEAILDYLFLYYYFLLKGKKFEALSSGSTFKAITKGEVEHFKIPLPPLPEQQKIVKILSDVDDSIQKADDAIANTERLKKGMMQELLTKGIGHKEFKKSKMGRIPKEWDVSSLSKYIGLQSGSYFKFSEFKKEGIRCLKIDNVGFGEVVWETETRLPTEYLEKHEELILNKDDIVIALNRPIINGRLKIGIVTEEDTPSILYQRVGRVTFKDRKNLSPIYLFYCLTSNRFKNELNRFLIGTDQPYIRTPLFLKIKLPLPPLPEQKQIAEILSDIDKKIELQKNKKQHLLKAKKGLMNDLLTGKRRVKV